MAQANINWTLNSSIDAQTVHALAPFSIEVCAKSGYSVIQVRML